MDVMDKTGPRPADDERRADRRPPGLMEVTVADAAELDQVLGDAIAVVAEAADQHGVGVLVTRTGVGRYIVRAHPAVPYGLTRQQHG